MKSKCIKAQTIHPVRGSIEFFDLCAFHSDKYAVTLGPKKSASRFLKMAAIEKLEKIGVPKKYLESII